MMTGRMIHTALYILPVVTLIAAIQLVAHELEPRFAQLCSRKLANPINLSCVLALSGLCNPAPHARTLKRNRVAKGSVNLH